MTGQTISHYRVLEKLGEGGMGVVYKAEDLKLKRLVALKFLPPRVVENPESHERFVREAQAAAALHHPNICTIFELDEDNGFLAMELIEGPSLKSKIEDRPLKLEDAVRIAAEVADGLKAAHEKGIVHRDIKSGNILLTDDGQARITDFGLATLADQTRVTKTGTALGTPGYMAPEQARGEKVDRRADIWSLGVVLYEMLSGRLPFRGNSEAAIVHSILHDAPEPLTAVRSGLPLALDRVLDKALAKDPGARYQHVDDLLVDLRGVSRLAASPARAAVWRRPLFIGAVAAVLLAAAGAGVYVTRLRHGADESGQVSLAVLPFVSTAGDPNLEYLSDGIPETLTNTLSRMPRLRVVPRARSFQYKGARIDPVAAGRELGARTVLTGRVAMRGNSLNLQVELVDVQTESQLWGEQYTRPITDMQAIQDQITLAVAKKLQVSSAAPAPGGTKNYTENAEAYQLYLRGRYYWDRRTVGMLKKATEQFQLALAKDPTYALAYAGLAEAYAVYGIYNVTSPDQSAPLAKAAVREALRLDDGIAEAHTAMAFVMMTYDFDLAGAEAEYKKALELNPQHPTAHFWYGLYHVARRQNEEGIAEFRRAQEAAPLSLNVNSYVAWGLMCARRTDQAVEQLRKTLDIDPNFPNAHLFMGLCYEQQGKHAQAVEEIQKARDLSEGNLLMIGALGHAYGSAGRRLEAEKVLEEMRQLRKQRYVAALDFAYVYAGLKDKEKALEWMEKAYTERSAWVLYTGSDPRLDWLQAEPRFRAVLRRMNLGT